jgi:hypothetical protein
MTYTILQPRNRWTSVERGGPFLREYVARRSDGALRVILHPSDTLPAGTVTTARRSAVAA